MILIDFAEEDDKNNNLNKVNKSSGQYKFDTCKHRSLEQETKRVQTCSCGTKKMVTAYSCIKRGIFPLNPNICSGCALWEPREDSQQ